MEVTPTRGAVLKGSLVALAAGLLAACTPQQKNESPLRAAAPSPAGSRTPSGTTSPATTEGTPTMGSTATPSRSGDSSAPLVSPAGVCAAARARLSQPEQARLDQDLIRAAKADDPARVRQLIEQGGDVNAKDSIQDSAYLYAGAQGFNEVLRLTLAAGADVESINRFGGTALIPACEHGHVETIRILIAAGVNVNHVNRLGWTGMQEAILLNHGGPDQQEAVRLLLAAGADPGIRDPEGRTALENARRMGFAEIVKIIERHG